MELVEASVDEYVKASSRQDKSFIISKIVDQVLDRTNPRGGFIMRNSQTKEWQKVDIKVARDKVGSYLREVAKRGNNAITGGSLAKQLHEEPGFFGRSLSRLMEQQSWSVSADNLRQQTALSRASRMESAMMSHSYLEPQYQHQHEQQIFSKGPMLPVPHLTATMMNQPNHPLDRNLFMAETMEGFRGDTTNPPSTSRSASSSPDEASMRASLEALAATFFVEDNSDFDLEPRPIEDMLP